MAKSCQGLNSKCFLIAYLVIVSFLLILWLTRQPLIYEDTRDIPVELQTYLRSPPQLIVPVNVKHNNEWALTSRWLDDKWTLVYFTHGHCFPRCNNTLNKMLAFQAAYASQDVQLLLIDIDSTDTAQGQLRQALQQSGINISVAEGDEKVITSLAQAFIALYLKTDYSDGSYEIEQEHNLFIVDPKSRVYATFKESVSSLTINQAFLQLRSFYAQTE
tara:strand:- start:222 stop:872 length:651 start_codon:yes stop_codon:yes gene_type:complete